MLRAGVWNFALEELIKVRLSLACCQHLGVGELATHLFALKHWGVGRDLLSGRVTLLEPQRRGAVAAGRAFEPCAATPRSRVC